MNLSKCKKRAKCNVCGRVRYTVKLNKFNGHSYCKLTGSFSQVNSIVYIPLYEDGKKKSSVGITKCQRVLIESISDNVRTAVDLNNNLIDHLFSIHSDKTNLKLTLK